MNITKSKRTMVVSLVIIFVLVLFGVLAAQKYHWFDIGCSDIIGDGYAMGTDPEPVVIGRSCN